MDSKKVILRCLGISVGAKCHTVGSSRSFDTSLFVEC